MLNTVLVRDEILHVLGQQACFKPTDWPFVLGALLKLDALPVDDHGDQTVRQRDRIRVALDRPNPPVGSMLPRLRQAAATLAALVDAGTPPDAIAIWNAFPRLTRESCNQLANRLAELVEPVGRLDLPKPPASSRTAPRPPPAGGEGHPTPHAV
jgi:hypothetical protein